MSGLVVHSAVVFDGFGVVPEDSVRVRDGHIVEVGRGLRAGPAEDSIDADGGTVMPGLIDAHVHVGSKGALVRALRFGVTSVCDQFMDWKLARQLRDDDNGDGLDAAALFSAGTLATAPDGHGSKGLVGPVPTLIAPEEADAFVAERVREGSDWIKVVYDDFSSYGQSLPTLDEDTLRAVVDAAHRHHRKVVAHIGSLSGARVALNAGVDVLGHWVSDALPDNELTDDIRRHGTVVIPTLCLLASVAGHDHAGLAADQRLAPFLSERDRAELSRSVGQGQPNINVDNGLAGVAALADAGVPILAGTDAPFPGMVHGASLHAELEALVRAGLSPTASLTAATSAPAAHLALPSRGRLAVGYRADMVLVGGDPTTDITETRNITAIWKQGRPITRHPELQRHYPALVAHGEPLLAVCRGPEIEALAGTAWMAFTDHVAGGHSTATLRTVDSDAAPSGWAIEVSGEIGRAGGWAGIAVYPRTDRAAADLSAWLGLEVSLRQDHDRAMAAMLVLDSRGRASPPQRVLHVATSWQPCSLNWNDFEGSDGHDVRLLAVLAAGAPGPYRFELSAPTLRLALSTDVGVR